MSGLFFDADGGFTLRESAIVKGLGWLAYYGARALAFALFAGGIAAFARGRPFLKLSGKAWLFLFLALVIGPGLVANVVFKDHWGRARPREIAAFGGASRFTPPLVISDQCESNCSFVSGDGAFGFFLPCFAYVVPKRRRRVFWGSTALGSVFGIARIVSGAHFLSDVLFAGFFMFCTTAFLHAALFGARATADRWREFFGRAAESND